MNRNNLPNINKFKNKLFLLFCIYFSNTVNRSACAQNGFYQSRDWADILHAAAGGYPAIYQLHGQIIHCIIYSTQGPVQAYRFDIQACTIVHVGPRSFRHRIFSTSGSRFQFRFFNFFMWGGPQYRAKITLSWNWWHSPVTLLQVVKNCGMAGGCKGLNRAGRRISVAAL